MDSQVLTVTYTNCMYIIILSVISSKLAGLSQTGSYVDASSTPKVVADLKRAVEIYVKNDVDLIICEVIHTKMIKRL